MVCHGFLCEQKTFSEAIDRAFRCLFKEGFNDLIWLLSGGQC